MTTPNTTIEYELTYLARNIPPEIRDALPVRLVDVYIPDDPSGHPRLRLRKKGGTYEITKKTEVNGADSSVQTEQTIPLTQAEFESLASGHNRMVEKDRYAVTIEGRAAEVDIFSGKLEGLVIIDFEFESSAVKDAFTPPACCLAEVTQDVNIAGGMLAGKSFDDVKTSLAQYGYQPLSM